MRKEHHGGLSFGKRPHCGVGGEGKENLPKNEEAGEKGTRDPRQDHTDMEKQTKEEVVRGVKGNGD